MTESTTHRLIEAMLNSRKINSDTRSELEEYLGDVMRSELHPDDARYVAALARRLGFDDAGTAADAGVEADAVETDEETAEDLTQRALAAEARVRELEDRLAAGGQVAQALAEVRDAFSRIYAPEGLTHEGLSKDVDAERYKDFLERIEAIERKFRAG